MMGSYLRLGENPKGFGDSCVKYSVIVESKWSLNKVYGPLRRGNWASITWTIYFKGPYNFQRSRLSYPYLDRLEIKLESPHA